uniref:ABC transporter permease n=1 Tax=Caldilinea aerophila TaxID=133453 RepID=A0A7C1JDS5_9CHLR
MSAKKQSPWLALVSILIYFFLYTPIIVLIVFSFNASRTNVVFEGVVNQGPCGPFYWYCELFRNRSVMDATRNTLIIAFTSTIVSTIIGTMAALALQRYDFFGKKVSETTLYFPIVTPEIVMGIGILVFFSAVFGWINTALALAPSQRLTMGLGTVIVSHIAFSIPFVTLVVRARLHGFDDRLEEAAMDLGADEFTTFRKITLPLIAPGVLAGAMLAFTLSLDDFIITFFTTGPGATTLPIYVYGLLRRIVTPELNALSTIWVFVVLIVVAISQWFQRRE